MNYKQYFVEIGKGARSGKVAVYEQEGLPEFRDEPILFTHATGFHAHCWDEVVRQLPDRHIYLLDTRCHGLSSNLEPPFTWTEFSEDLIEVIQKLDLENIISVGHSMGGHLAIRAAGTMPERYKAVLAIDPVIVTEGARRMKDLVPEGFEMPVAKRRNEWSSSQEMYDSFSKKPPFNKWHPNVLRDYCNFGLVKEGQEKNNSHYSLACPPRLEAEIYQTMDPEGVYEVIPNILCPVKIVRARERKQEDPPFSFEPSPTNPQLVTFFQNGSDLHLKENSHFIPMEIPHKVAEMVKELL